MYRTCFSRPRALLKWLVQPVNLASLPPTIEIDPTTREITGSRMESEQGVLQSAEIPSLG